jgi:hypothetical protein
MQYAFPRDTPGTVMLAADRASLQEHDDDDDDDDDDDEEMRKLRRRARLLRVSEG